jgi:uncharacterized Rossmann fold enzyme
MQPIGEKWLRTFYPRICAALSYSKQKDENSRDLLSELLVSKTPVAPAVPFGKMRRSSIVMFGAGPSLENDLRGVSTFINESEPVVIAADGAADALYESDIKPSIIVSDLDSCSLETLKRASRESFVFVHAHGDNTALISRIVPELGNSIAGTTQAASVPNVLNYGGLTDGDRACFIATTFEPALVILAGMNFGSTEGKYSKNKYSSVFNPLRASKLAWGKASLEFLVRERPEIRFLDASKGGEIVEGIPRVSYRELTLGAFESFLR